MLYEIVYYSARVQGEILSFPADILADFLRLSELLEEFGPELRLRIPEPWGTDFLS
jgi:hypothetical protein